MNDPEQNFVLIIHVSFLPLSKPPHTHPTPDAEVLPLAPLRAQALAIYPERTLAHRPGMLRIFLISPLFPRSCTTPFGGRATSGGSSGCSGR
ncbi:hypothetical protein B0H14DRAFT_3428835 [Mycena olivaceomarginata]|nr:hypothetical protein B0H14DRAFT_3428835 [Mycena olivaceomarginata]